MKKVWQTLKKRTSMNGARFRRENENLSYSADVLPKTSNLIISRCCFADDGKEMDKSEKHARAERAKLLVLLTKYENL